MFTGYLSVALVLSALLLYAAARKLSHRSDVVAAYERVGVREARLNLLAGLLIAGAAGLLIGVVAAPVGMAAARCLVVYFLAAVVAHVRHRDVANVWTPVVLLLLSLAAVFFRAGAGGVE